MTCSIEVTLDTGQRSFIDAYSVSDVTEIRNVAGPEAELYAQGVRVSIKRGGDDVQHLRTSYDALLAKLTNKTVQDRLRDAEAERDLRDLENGYRSSSPWHDSN